MTKSTWLAPALLVSLLAGCGLNPGTNLSTSRSLANADFRADGTSRSEVVAHFSRSVSGMPYQIKKTIRGINASVIAVPAGRTPEAVIADLKAHYGVSYAENVNRVVLEVTPNDPMIKDQYSLSISNALKAWDVQPGSMSVPIAVIDTGIDPDHPDLKSKVVKTWNVFTKTPAVHDGAGHGTHTAGIAAAAANNGLGGSGVAPGCGLMIVQVLDENGGGSDQTIADGVVWAADNGAKVMTMSLGLYKHSKVIEDALQYALDHDVVLCASAGNNNAENEPTTAPHLPSTYPGVIEVAATDNQDKKASFSNWGINVSVAAPGVNILSTVPTYAWSGSERSYGTMSGTSMASPFAAGVAGLIRSQHPEWNRTQVRHALEASATDLGTAGFDKMFGNGRVDALKAVTL